ncbi:squalene/phytoene synthase family protein [Streptomyces sp. NPDC004232]|uniref:phytoene/squalene synthase family protein n=1 Tax=Streptomyces sp. NPDC004232 TaxID=3154454 RepID=UPI001D5DA404|nr:squalene/phytoene synthase family protein [Streptomyces sp. tea 10]
MLVRRWLDAAGIKDPVLRECYTVCARAALRERGGVGWVGTLAAPPERRAHAAAMTMVILEADDRVDTGPPEARLRRLDEWIDAWYAALESGGSSDPVLHAAAHACSTVFDSPPRALMEECFAALRRSWEATEFATYEDWQTWATGSSGASAVLIMSTWDALGEAGQVGEGIVRGYGDAFQMVDCLADLSEDLREGQLYLPLEDLDRFGVRREDLEAGRWTAATRELIAFEVARITSGLPALLDSTRQHPWLHRYAPAFDTLTRALCAAVLAAGPSILRCVAVPPTGPMVQAGLGLWRAALAG